MTRGFRFAGLGLIALVLAACASRPGTTERIELVILATADVHGRVMPWDYTEDREDAAHSLLKAATLIEQLRGRHPHVLLLDAGDFLQGNLFADFHATAGRVDGRQHPLFVLFDAMAYDAVVVGNHEFDFGLDYLQAQAALTRTPLLAGNVLRVEDGHSAWPGWRMFERGPLRVAVVGLTTPGSAVWHRAALEGRLRFEDGVEAGRRLVAEAREAGADLVIALLHSGLDGGDPMPGSPGPENFGRALIEQVPGIDALIVSHTHRLVEGLQLRGADGRSVPVVQPGRWASHLGKIELRLQRSAGQGWQQTGASSRVLPVAEAAPHPALMARVAEAHAAARAYANEVIAQTPEVWDAARARLEDTPIVDLIQTVQKQVSGAQLSASPAFTTTLRFGPGPILRRHLAQLYPYENTLVKLEIDGAGLIRYLEHAAAYYQGVVDGQPQPTPGWPGFNFDVLAGLDYDFDLARPPGQRLLRLNYQGQPIGLLQRFTLALNSYRAFGGGAYPGLENARVIAEFEGAVRGMIEAWLRERGEVRHEDVFERNWRMLTPE